MAYDGETDGETAALLNKHDPRAIEALILRYRHRLYRYLLRLVQDRALAEDLFQQTWLRVVESAGRFDTRRAFEPWLFSIAHHLAIDVLRRKRPESLECPANLRARSAGALEQVLARERTRAIEAAMAGLPAHYRETLTLRFEEDMKLEEIAETLGAPLPTVKSRLRRGLEALRTLLEER